MHVFSHSKHFSFSDIPHLSNQLLFEQLSNQNRFFVIDNMFYFIVNKVYQLAVNMY